MTWLVCHFYYDEYDRASMKDMYSNPDAVATFAKYSNAREYIGLLDDCSEQIGDMGRSGTGHCFFCVELGKPFYIIYDREEKQPIISEVFYSREEALKRIDYLENVSCKPLKIDAIDIRENTQWYDEDMIFGEDGCFDGKEDKYALKALKKSRKHRDENALSS